MNTARALSAIALASLVLLTQSGCLLVAAAAGTGTAVAYVKGDTEAVVAHSPEQVTTAAKAVAADMKFAVVSSESTGVDGRLVARTAGDTKIVVTAKHIGDKATKVTVRVGNFGDTALQADVLAKVKAKLEGSEAVAKTE